MAGFVGFDLGTTFSAVGHIDKAGRPVIIPNKDGDRITPSIVSYQDGARYVGKEAKMAIRSNREFTHEAFKSQMGRSKTYSDGNTLRTPTELSAAVLERLRADAEKVMGPIDNAVVTIPANFEESARHATMEAAKMAGLNIKHIISEPTAAALYYAMESEEPLAGNYAVYDLGGGTFDISIVKLSDFNVEVLASEGDRELGGKNFDSELWKIVAAHYKSETGGDLDEEDYSLDRIEEDKISLSSRDECSIRVRSTAGKAKFTVTRVEFEEKISTWMEKTVMACEIALEEAGLVPGDIQGVFLAGGSTRLPCVRTSVKRVFGQEPLAKANVDEVVALGAALYAMYKAAPEELEKNPMHKTKVAAMNVTDITPHYYGIVVFDIRESRDAPTLQNSIIIKKGLSLPVKIEEEFLTTYDNQIGVKCSVTQSKTPETDPTFVTKVWEGMLDVPSGRPAGQQIKVTFSYNVNGMMNCSFVDVASGNKKVVDVHASGPAKVASQDIEKFTVE